jgi:aspartyl-tRNA(Asn)/glutamyl-tRNA(Gln) amidotransferase subunit C
MEFSQDTTHLDVKYIASLAHIALSDDEIKLLQPQMQEILSFFEELKQLDIGPEELETTGNDAAVWRPDEKGAELGQEIAMNVAVQNRHEQFVVPKIIE